MFLVSSNVQMYEVRAQQKYKVILIMLHSPLDYTNILKQFNPIYKDIDESNQSFWVVSFLG